MLSSTSSPSSSSWLELVLLGLLLELRGRRRTAEDRPDGAQGRARVRRRRDVSGMWRRSGLGLERRTASVRRGLVAGGVILGLVRRQLRRQLERRLGLVRLSVFVERLPLLRRRGVREPASGAAAASAAASVFPAELGPAANRAERLALGALDLGRVGAAPALEVEVLADRVVE